MFQNPIKHTYHNAVKYYSSYEIPKNAKYKQNFKTKKVTAIIISIVYGSFFFYKTNKYDLTTGTTL